MKKYGDKHQIITLLLILSIMLTGCASSIEETPSEENISDENNFAEKIAAANADVEGLSLENVTALAAKNHEPFTVPNDLYAEDLKLYYHADSGLLTQEEIYALREEREKADSITKEKAMEDADLFFRTWKYAYPSYYFLGEELFEEARSEVMGKLESLEETISGQQMADILYDSMCFLQDAHSTIDRKNPAALEDNLNYVYYYDYDILFSRDDTGYYITLDDGRWYYETSSNQNLQIEPTLTEDGRIVYSPMVLASRADAEESSTITLQNGEESMKLTLNWLPAADVRGTGAVNKQCLTTAMNDIYYIDYLDMDPENGDVNDFLKTADEARNYSAVIFDLRHTMGMTHWQLLEWIERFTGEYPVLNETEMTRNNALRTAANYGGFERVSVGNESMKISSCQGKLVENDIPLIIITDKSVGSSVEAAALYLQTVENSIVIGANTFGCQLGGSCQQYYLPHSGVPFGIGGFMKFNGQVKNIDGIGFKPDIWCEPEQAVRASLEMLRNYGYISEEETLELKNIIAPVYTELRVIWGDGIIEPGQCFGAIADFELDIEVMADGEKITDFTVTAGDPSLLSVNQKENGKVGLKTMKYLEGENVSFTITYQGIDYVFYTHDDSYDV